MQQRNNLIVMLHPTLLAQTHKVIGFYLPLLKVTALTGTAEQQREQLREGFLNSILNFNFFFKQWKLLGN